MKTLTIYGIFGILEDGSKLPIIFFLNRESAIKHADTIWAKGSPQLLGCKRLEIDVIAAIED